MGTKKFKVLIAVLVLGTILGTGCSNLQKMNNAQENSQEKSSKVEKQTSNNEQNIKYYEGSKTEFLKKQGEKSKSKMQGDKFYSSKTVKKGDMKFFFNSVVYNDEESYFHFAYESEVGNRQKYVNINEFEILNHDYTLYVNESKKRSAKYLDYNDTKDLLIKIPKSKEEIKEIEMKVNVNGKRYRIYYSFL